MYATLVLEDGTVLEGEGFGAGGEVFGEVVFNTSMCGYQEALTDPSYKGQILLLTYPLVGNYGVNSEDFESDGIKVEGFAVREYCSAPSHRAAERDIDTFLRENKTPGIAGIDTRALTIKIREYGTMKGALKTSASPIEGGELLERAREARGIGELDLVSQVTCREPRRYGEGRRHVVLVDCGMKYSILRNLLKRGVAVTVVPAAMPAKDILGLEPDGIVVSNGPGDPVRAPYAIEALRELMEEKPIFGICLGHQLLALAAGGRTYKLKFGHRGVNQPVKDLRLGRVFITSQNHGYAVDAASMEGTGFEVSRINLNDRTVEGLRHHELPVSSIQYHAEAHPGPLENEYLFDEFLRTIKEENK